ncbi:hypothetical protein Pf1_01476 [Flavobacterium columnare]|nr:hypothetical protein Pf1_01476 [Flavobacterium columnare]
MKKSKIESNSQQIKKLIKRVLDCETVQRYKKLKAIYNCNIC